MSLETKINFLIVFNDISTISKYIKLNWKIVKVLTKIV